MKNYLENAGFYITDDSTFMEKEHAITEDLSYWINRLHLDVLKKKPGTADRLIKLIQKNPKNPQLKNLLTSYYIQTNQKERAYELNRKTLVAHPDYFFAKLNLANEYINNEEFEKVLEVLGENFDLKELYPDRDTFHFAEVMSMYKFAVVYHSAIHQFDTAEDFLERMKAVDPDDIEVENAENVIFQQKIIAASERFVKETENRLEVKTAEKIATVKTEKPEFNHPEIEQLYQNDARISTDLLDQILNLPRPSLIEDLVKVLNDSVERFSYFEEGAWEDETLDFVFHAINLLAELEAVEQLEAILNILKQSEDFIDLFLEEFLAEFIWLSIYKLGRNQLNVLENFMKLPHVSTYSKIEISKAVTQIAVHQPEGREEVIQWYQSVFKFYKEAPLEANVIDSDLIGMMISDVLDFKAIELLPEITDLFKMQYVSSGMCGDLEDVEQSLNISPSENQKLEVLTIKEIYQDITATWAGYNDSEESTPSLPKVNLMKSSEVATIPDKPFLAEPKIGRNDPCVCGSGKKYKKCCLGK